MKKIKKLKMATFKEYLKIITVIILNLLRNHGKIIESHLLLLLNKQNILSIISAKYSNKTLKSLKLSI